MSNSEPKYSFKEAAEWLNLDPKELRRKKDFPIHDLMLVVGHSYRIHKRMWCLSTLIKVKNAWKISKKPA